MVSLKLAIRETRLGSVEPSWKLQPACLIQADCTPLSIPFVFLIYYWPHVRQFLENCYPDGAMASHAVGHYALSTAHLSSCDLESEADQELSHISGISELSNRTDLEVD